MPTFQPILNPASTKPFISPGVGDNSWGELLGNAANLGMKVHFANEGTKMMEGMQGDIQTYLGQNQEAAAREEAYNQYMQEAVKTENTLFDQAGVIPEHIGIGGLGGEGVDQFPGSVAPNMITADDIDAVQKNMSQTLNKYILAQQQGKMSIDQLQTRIQATVKQAAANNPLIQDELIQQAAKYMDMTGASSYIKNALKEEEKAAKQRDEVRQQYIGWAKQFGISMNRPNWEKEAEEQAVITQNHKLIQDRIKEAMDRRTLGRQQLSELVNDPKNRQTFIQGALGTIHQMYQHASATQKSANDVFSLTNLEISKQIAYINSISAYLPSEERSSLQGEIKLLEDQRAIYKDLIEMGPNKAVAESRLAVAQVTAKLPFVSANEQLDLNQKIASTLNFIAQATNEFIPTSIGKDAQGRDISVMSLIDPNALVNMVHGLNKAISPYDTTPSPALAKLSTPDGKMSVQVMSNLQSPQTNPDAIRMNSHSISQMLTHLATVKDPDQATQATDIFIKQMLDSSKAAGLTMGQMLDTPTYNKLNEHLGKLMGNFRQGTGKVDYDPNLNRFSYLNEDGSINAVASERANMLFKSLISLNGFKDEDTIDKWGSVISDTAMKSQPGQKQPVFIHTLEEAFNAFDNGDIDEAEYRFLVKDINSKQDQGSNLNIQAPDPTIPTLSPEAKDRLSSNKDYGYGKREDGTNKGLGFFGEIPTKDGQKMTELSFEADGIFAPLLVPTLTREEINLLASGQKSTEAIYQKAIAHAKKRIAEGKSPFAEEGEQQALPMSSSFIKELRNPKPKQQMNVKEESRKKFYDTLKMTLASTQQASPLLKRNPTEDAIESVSYIQALDDVPVVGPAVEAALIAFGFTNAIPALAKRLPKAMAASGKVVPTSSNVVVAGGNASASKATANIMMREASKVEAAKAKELYQQFWKTEWKLGYPKTDLEWSNAIGEANRWVATKMDKSFKIKSMEKK